MGNRFGIHGLEAASTHSERDVSAARISEVSRPTEDPVLVRETRSDFGSSCPDPEDKQTKFAARHIIIIIIITLYLLYLQRNYIALPSILCAANFSAPYRQL